MRVAKFMLEFPSLALCSAELRSQWVLRTGSWCRAAADASETAVAALCLCNRQAYEFREGNLQR